MFGLVEGDLFAFCTPPPFYVSYLLKELAFPFFVCCSLTCLSSAERNLATIGVSRCGITTPLIYWSMTRCFVDFDERMGGAISILT